MDERVDSLEVTVRHLVNEWVPSLQVKVERLDTYAGPGQNDAFSDSFQEIRKKLDRISTVQGRHTRTLSQHGKMLTGLKGDVRTLKADMTEVKGDVSTLKSDVSTLKSDVSTLKSDVSTLKSDMVEVKGALAEILDRLPAKGA
jgi:chromosome segregation ATPase